VVFVVLGVMGDLTLRIWFLRPDLVTGLHCAIMGLSIAYGVTLAVGWFGFLGAWIVLRAHRRAIQAMWLRAGLVWHGPVGIGYTSALGLIAAYVSTHRTMLPVWMCALPVCWEIAATVGLRVRKRRKCRGSGLIAPKVGMAALIRKCTAALPIWIRRLLSRK